jgi:hypothetical protein|tara:strand:- start:225 stop:596 length:372 start_codon:yes stop_codon:yes gene_type:complete
MIVKKRDIDSYLHEEASKWLGSDWGLKQTSTPIPTPNLIFKVPNVVDRNQPGRLTITQRVRLARADTVPVVEKFCNKCKVIKPATQFGKNKNGKNGLQNYCNICKRKADNLTKQKKKEKDKWK